ncbi:MAG TPA: hypothetical protein VHF22_04760, partial [Planctomycetota bacterium]|nr:hypothetical protein [Planctomycetota bacterium]
SPSATAAREILRRDLQAGLAGELRTAAQEALARTSEQATLADEPPAVRLRRLERALASGDAAGARAAVLSFLERPEHLARADDAAAFARAAEIVAGPTADLDGETVSAVLRAVDALSQRSGQSAAVEALLAPKAVRDALAKIGVAALDDPQIRAPAAVLEALTTALDLDPRDALLERIGAAGAAGRALDLLIETEMSAAGAVVGAALARARPDVLPEAISRAARKLLLNRERADEARAELRRRVAERVAALSTGIFPALSKLASLLEANEGLAAEVVRVRRILADRLGAAAPAPQPSNAEEAARAVESAAEARGAARAMADEQVGSVARGPFAEEALRDLLAAARSRPAILLVRQLEAARLASALPDLLQGAASSDPYVARAALEALVEAYAPTFTGTGGLAPVRVEPREIIEALAARVAAAHRDADDAETDRRLAREELLASVAADLAPSLERIEATLAAYEDFRRALRGMDLMPVEEVLGARITREKIDPERHSVALEGGTRGTSKFVVMTHGIRIGRTADRATVKARLEVRPDDAEPSVEKP